MLHWLKRVAIQNTEQAIQNRYSWQIVTNEASAETAQLELEINSCPAIRKDLLSTRHLIVNRPQQQRRSSTIMKTRKKSLLLILLGIMILALPWLSVAQPNRGQGVQRQEGSSVVPGWYSESHALVIGVSNYTNGWRKLPGVKRDVEQVSTALRQHGFKVDVVTDPTKAAFEQAFGDFIGRHGGGNAKDHRVLIYFAGHGHTLETNDGRKMGYIVPADAPRPDPNQLGQFKRFAISMDQINTYALELEAKHALFVFDSCFSGMMFETRGAPTPAILSKITQPVRQFITAGTEEQEVPDESFFRRQFVAGLGGDADANHDGFVTGSELGQFLEDTVANYSRSQQTPRWGKIRNPSLDKGDFVFQVSVNAALTATTPAPVRPTAPASSLPMADEIIAKFEQAVGGRETFQRVKSFHYKQTWTFDSGVSGPVEFLGKAPNKQLMMVNFPAPGTIQMGFNGTRAWAQDPRDGLRDLRSEEAMPAEEMDIHLYVKLREAYKKLTVQSKTQVGDKAAWLVEATNQRGDVQKMYFDAQTGLLLRRDSEVVTPKGKSSTVEYIESYREISGVKIPATGRVSGPMGNYNYRLDDAKVNVSIDDARFERPKATAFRIHTDAITMGQLGIRVLVMIDNVQVGTISNMQPPLDFMVKQFAPGNHTYRLTAEIYAFNYAGQPYLANRQEGVGTITVVEGADFHVGIGMDGRPSLYRER